MLYDDLILMGLFDLQPQKKELQDACYALGVSSDGSIADMMNRLEELLNFKDVYPKLYVKLQKAGGEKQLDIRLFCLFVFFKTSQTTMVLYNNFFLFFWWCPSFFLYAWRCLLSELSLLNGVSKRPHRRAAKFQALSYMLHFGCSWTGCSPH